MFRAIVILRMKIEAKYLFKNLKRTLQSNNYNFKIKNFILLDKRKLFVKRKLNKIFKNCKDKQTI